MAGLKRGFAGGLFLVIVLAGSLVAQETPKAPPSSGQPKVSTPAAAPRSAKEERDAAIAADTEKLYQLAEELKAEVAKSNKDTLSLTVIRKAAEIEKLAHSLRERLKKD